MRWEEAINSKVSRSAYKSFSSKVIFMNFPTPTRTLVSFKTADLNCFTVTYPLYEIYY